ncbi:hypothetical protein HZC07_03980 [Candidatus Micrarchaeota archaeon]|nr:hypothetical protein [Candidatus Micrarchaeota archaeon]
MSPSGGVVQHARVHEPAERPRDERRFVAGAATTNGASTHGSSHSPFPQSLPLLSRGEFDSLVTATKTLPDGSEERTQAIDGIFERLLSASAILSGSSDDSLLRLVYSIAREVHKGAKRKDPASDRQLRRDYLVHPLGVAHFVASLGAAADVIAMAIGHDIIEEATKSGVTVNYSMLKEILPPRVALGIALLSNLKCVGPKACTQSNPQWIVGATHYWVAATSPAYNYVREYYKSRDLEMADSVYFEMRKLGLAQILNRDGIRAYNVKLGDDVENLYDIGNLPEGRRRRKLADTLDHAAIAVRLDWRSHFAYRGGLRAVGIEVPDFSAEIEAQKRAGVIPCNSRRRLNVAMVKTLLIRYPGSTEWAVYCDPAETHRTNSLEIGFPRTENGFSPLAVLKEERHALQVLRRTLGEKVGRLSVSPGRSLLCGTGAGAQEIIMRLEGVSCSTISRTKLMIDRLIGDVLKPLQQRLAGNNSP